MAPGGPHKSTGLLSDFSRVLRCRCGQGGEEHEIATKVGDFKALATYSECLLTSSSSDNKRQLSKALSRTLKKLSEGTPLGSSNRWDAEALQGPDEDHWQT